MTVKTLDDITTEFPVPVAGESTKTFLGKVKKFFSDTKNWMTGVCLIGQIVNNCVTNNAKLPLSAAQGKVLMDLYTVLNTKITDTSRAANAANAKIELNGPLKIIAYGSDKINGRSSSSFPMVSYCRWVLVRQKYFTIITMEQSGFASGHCVKANP